MPRCSHSRAESQSFQQIPRFGLLKKTSEMDMFWEVWHFRGALHWRSAGDLITPELKGKEWSIVDLLDIFGFKLEKQHLKMCDYDERVFAFPKNSIEAVP